MKQLLKDHPDAVEFTTEQGNPLLTASTGALRAFVERFTSHEKLFSEKVALKRFTP